MTFKYVFDALHMYKFRATFTSRVFPSMFEHCAFIWTVLLGIFYRKPLMVQEQVVACQWLSDLSHLECVSASALDNTKVVISKRFGWGFDSNLPFYSPVCLGVCCSLWEDICPSLRVSNWPGTSWQSFGHLKCPKHSRKHLTRLQGWSCTLGLTPSMGQDI